MLTFTVCALRTFTDLIVKCAARACAILLQTVVAAVRFVSNCFLSIFRLGEYLSLDFARAHVLYTVEKVDERGEMGKLQELIC